MNSNHEVWQCKHYSLLVFSYNLHVYNSGRAWASPEFRRNIWQIRCTYVCMYVCMYVAIRRPCVHHAARMRIAQSITSCQRLVTLSNAHQRSKPWPLKKNPSTAAIEKRSRSSTEENRNSRKEKKEIGKAKAEQGIGNAEDAHDAYYLDTQQPTAVS